MTSTSGRFPARMATAPEAEVPAGRTAATSGGEPERRAGTVFGVADGDQVLSLNLPVDLIAHRDGMPRRRPRPGSCTRTAAWLIMDHLRPHDARSPGSCRPRALR